MCTGPVPFAGAAHRLGEDMHLQRLLGAVRLRHRRAAEEGVLLDVRHRGLHHATICALPVSVSLARPSLVFSVSLLPSTFSIVPRTRTVCACCAEAVAHDACDQRASQMILIFCHVIPLEIEARRRRIGGALQSSCIDLSRPSLRRIDIAADGDVGRGQRAVGLLFRAADENLVPDLEVGGAAGHVLRDGVPGGTMTFFSPSLYLTNRFWPSLPATVVATLALVMVLPGRLSQPGTGRPRRPSATP